MGEASGQEQGQHGGDATTAGASNEDALFAAADWRSKAITKLDQMPREMIKCECRPSMRWTLIALAATTHAFPTPHILRPRRSFPDWYSRYRLFSLYDSGILLDAQSWYSATPESIAARIATRCCVAGPRNSNGSKHARPLTILDPFCGAGGNTIQFALAANGGGEADGPPVKIIAIDLDPVKVEMARHNARIYGVPEGQIVWLVGDALHFMRDWVQAHSPSEGSGSGTSKRAQSGAWAGQEHAEIDVVFLSPPWGGVAYQEPGSQANTPAQTPVRKAGPAMGSTKQEASGTSGASPSDVDPALLQQFDLPLAFASRQTRAESHDNPADDAPVSIPAVPKAAREDDARAERDPRHYSLDCLQPVPGNELVALASQITHNLCLYLPRNCSLKDIAGLRQYMKPALGSAAPASQHPLAIEEQFLGQSFKALTAYFGDLSAQWDPLTDEQVQRHGQLLERDWQPASRNLRRK